MALTWELIFTDRVTITPKATLGDGTDVTDYADSMVMEVNGISGDYESTYGEVVALGPNTAPIIHEYLVKLIEESKNK